MKKIFTLLIAVGMFALAQAQPGNRDNRQDDHRNDQRNDQQYDQQYDQRYDKQFGQNDFEKGYDKGRFTKDNDDFFGRESRSHDRFSMERKMRMRIASINQEYDYRIQKVKRSFFLTWFEKQRQVRFLENQRQWEIRMVYAKFNSYRFDDRNRRYDRNDRSQGHY